MTKATLQQFNKLKDYIYCVKHDLEYTPENIKIAYEKELELFGCKLLDEKHMFMGVSDPIECLVAWEWGSDDDGEDGIIYIDHYRGHFKETRANVKENYKILGTEITLAEILKALYKKAKRGLHTNVHGDKMLIGTYAEDDYYDKCYWNLSHDSLSWHAENEPGTIEFLYNLIFKK